MANYNVDVVLFRYDLPVKKLKHQTPCLQNNTTGSLSGPSGGICPGDICQWGYISGRGWGVSWGGRGGGGSAISTQLAAR